MRRREKQDKVEGMDAGQIREGAQQPPLYNQSQTRLRGTKSLIKESPGKVWEDPLSTALTQTLLGASHERE